MHITILLHFYLRIDCYMNKEIYNIYVIDNNKN